MQWKATPPKYGDIIRTKVTFYHHYGIFVSEDRVIQFGLPDNVNRPTEEIRVIATDIYAFLGGGELEVGCPDKTEAKSRRTPEKAVEIAESKIGDDGYHILHNNCEHFAFECAYGERRSTFVNGIRTQLRKKLGK